MSWRDKIAAVLAGKVGGPTPSGIHVYHSSPHDFDRFDLGKIGTGEGAQVYGHGIYAAENPAVSGQGGQYWNQFSRRFGDNPEGTAASFLALEGFDRDKAIARVKDQVQRNREFHKTAYMPPDERADAIARNARLKESFRLLESGAPVGPRTYEVNFRAKPEELLDWDKPIAGHPLLGELEKVGLRAHVASTRPGEPSFIPATGRDAYQSLVKDIGYGNIPAPAGYGNNPAGGASRMLADAGIPGIRYLDEGSRNAMARFPLAWQEEAVKRGQVTPTHNYVAFDPSKLDIMAKYGVVGGVPLGAATMGGTIDQSSYEARQ